MMRSALALALERQDWPMAALCLLLGVTEAATRLPPETLESLMELLEGPADGQGR